MNFTARNKPLAARFSAVFDPLAISAAFGCVGFRDRQSAERN